MRSYGHYCAAAKALDVVGDRWTLLIVRELLLQGGCRYTDLRNGLPGIATNLLSERLKDLEAHGIVRREEAPPPVASTLYLLTDAGRELEPVLRALLRWGVRYMPNPDGDEAFRSHWLAFPVSELLRDGEPGGPPVTIEVRVGELPSSIELGEGKVMVHVGASPAPDLVLAGEAPTVLGVLTGMIAIDDARVADLHVEGALGVLRRLEYVGPVDPERSDRQCR